MGATFQATKKSKGFCSPESRKFCCQQDIALYGRHRSCSHALYISTNDLHVLGESFPVSKHSSLSLDFIFYLYSANYLLSFGQLFFVGKGRRHLHAPHNLVHSIWFDPVGGIYVGLMVTTQLRGGIISLYAKRRWNISLDWIDVFLALSFLLCSYLLAAEVDSIFIRISTVAFIFLTLAFFRLFHCRKYIDFAA